MTHTALVASRWALAPVALLGSLLAGLAVMVTLATRDPGFAVEPDYYKKAVNWDREREQQAFNARLGYRLEVSLPGDTKPAGARQINVAFEDSLGLPISGARLSVSGFHNARAMRILQSKLRETSPGLYVTTLPVDRAGLWELRFSAERGAQRFTQVVRLDIPIGDGS